MGFALPNGAHVYLASAYGPSVSFKDATNAENVVLTVEDASELKAGDIVHVNCNWSGIDNVIAKIDAINDNAVTLRNINTTNTNKYAAGGGTGSIRKVLEWTELPQIVEVSKSGGDQNTTQIQFLSDDRQRNLNTYKSAVSQTYSIAHDSTLPVYALLRQLDEGEETVAAYMYVPKAKENRYWAATASFDDTPSTAVNEVETVSVVLNLQSPAMTFYKVDEGKPETVAVTGVSLDKTTLKIQLGDTATLTATVEPANATNQAVKWSSSDETVATVDDAGQVKGKMEGTADITATTVDGNKTATCAVTVATVK
ncbi:phage tail tube protein [Cronobacter dublinensis]|uniref:phage tail tube protein n=1 Tax=Cronobacter dublinensis TaxID=413497 RepID=UPI00300DE794